MWSVFSAASPLAVLMGLQQGAFLYLVLLLPVYALLATSEQIRQKFHCGSPKIFYALTMAGLVLSLPFVYRDGGMRSLSASVPFLASSIAIALYPQRVYSLVPWESNSVYGRCPWRRLITVAPAVLGAVIVFSALIGPAIAHALVQPKESPPDSSIDCANGEHKKFIALSAMAYADVPRRKPKLQVHELNEDIAFWEKVIPPSTIFFAYDAIERTSFFGYGPVNFESHARPYLTVCAARIGGGLWKVRSPE